MTIIRAFHWLFTKLFSRCIQQRLSNFIYRHKNIDQIYLNGDFRDAHPSKVIHNRHYLRDFSDIF